MTETAKAHKIQASFVGLLYGLTNFTLHLFATLLWPARRPAHAQSVAIYRIGNIGDIVCALPAMRAIRRAYPDAKLTLITSPGEKGQIGAKELLAGIDWINELVIYYTADIATFSGIRQLCAAVQKSKFDVWLELPNNLGWFRHKLRNMLFAKICGAKWARGWEIATIRIFQQAQSEYLYFRAETDRLLTMLDKLGIPSMSNDYGFPISGELSSATKQLVAHHELVPGTPWIAFAPGAKRSTNLWPVEYWVMLGKEVIAKGGGIVLIAGAADAATCSLIEDNLGPSVINLAGQCSLRESIAVLAKCQQVICVDSGVQHLASVAGAPVIALVSSRELYGKWRPNGSKNIVLQRAVSCHTCLLEVCSKNHECMTAIQPATVTKLLFLRSAN